MVVVEVVVEVELVVDVAVVVVVKILVEVLTGLVVEFMIEVVVEVVVDVVGVVVVVEVVVEPVVEVLVEVLFEIVIEVAAEVVNDSFVDVSVEIDVGIVEKAVEVCADWVDVVVFIDDGVVVCIVGVDDSVALDVINSLDSVVVWDTDDAVEDVDREVVTAELVVDVVVDVEVAESASKMLSGVVIVEEVDTFSDDITEGVDWVVDDVVAIKVVDVTAKDEDDACSTDVEVDSVPSISDDIETDEVVSEELSPEAFIFSVSNIVSTSSWSVSWSVSKMLNDFILKISSIDSFDESSDARTSNADVTSSIDAFSSIRMVATYSATVKATWTCLLDLTDFLVLELVSELFWEKFNSIIYISSTK